MAKAKDGGKRSKKKLTEKQRAELYVAAGGRCEFPNCGKRVDLHSVTHERKSFWEAAHNVAASSDGPRGDEARSEELADSLENHLLLCRNHHKGVDIVTQGHAYTEAELLDFKRRHEKHIEALLNIPLGKKTAVVVVQGRIADQSANFRPGDINNAVQCSNYTYAPIAPTPTHIDLNKLPLGNTDEYYHVISTGMIRQQLERDLRGPDLENAPLSVFALASMPDLVTLGFAIGNKREAVIYQYRHEASDWFWRDTDASAPVGFHINVPSGITGTDLALVISLSGVVADDWVQTVVPGMPTATITTDSPSRELLRSRIDIQAYALAVMDLFRRIQEVMLNLERLHIFPAMPAPLCVEFGRQIPPKQRPDIIMYDHRASDPEWSAQPIRLNLSEVP